MISTPRGYDPEVYSGFLPKFFCALDKTADKKSVQQFDFHLTRTANDDYSLLVVADEHVSGRVIDIPPGSGNVIAPVDSIQFRDDFMPRLVEYADSLMRHHGRSTGEPGRHDPIRNTGSATRRAWPNTCTWPKTPPS